MAITFVDGAEGEGTLVGTTLPINLPTCIAGDVILVGIHTNENFATTLPVAADPGWTLLVSVNYEGEVGQLQVWAKTALGTEGATGNWTVAAGEDQHLASSVAYRGASGSSLVATSGNSPGAVWSWTSPSYVALAAGGVSVLFCTSNGVPASIDSGSTLRSSGFNQFPIVIDRPVPAAGPTVGTTINASSGPRRYVGATVGLRIGNIAPTAPTLTSMVGSEYVDYTAVNRASHTFSDPDPGDWQTGADYRHRQVGSPTWIDVAAPGDTNTYYDYPAATFTSGVNYERQVRTYDSGSLVGPWSTSGYFTATDPATPPVITSPTVGETILVSVSQVDWTHTGQDAYQVRRVGDIAGTPDTATVYYDTGQINDSATRSIPLTFAVNNRDEHVQVRVKDGGVWSAWDSALVHIAFPAPPTPTFTVSPEADTASLLVEITNPAGTPTVTYNEVWVDDGDGYERRATDIDPDGSWRYWTPRSGRDYVAAIYVVAFTADGRSATSL